MAQVKLKEGCNSIRRGHCVGSLRWVIALGQAQSSAAQIGKKSFVGHEGETYLKGKKIAYGSGPCKSPRRVWQEKGQISTLGVLEVLDTTVTGLNWVESDTERGDSGGGLSKVLQSLEVEVGEIVEVEGLELCISEHEGSGGAQGGPPSCGLPQTFSASLGTPLDLSISSGQA